MSIIKHIQCDWCFKNISTGITMHYKIIDGKYIHDLKQSKNKLDYIESVSAGCINKHLCDNCIEDIIGLQSNDTSD